MENWQKRQPDTQYRRAAVKLILFLGSSTQNLSLVDFGV